MNHCGLHLCFRAPKSWPRRSWPTSRSLAGCGTSRRWSSARASGSRTARLSHRACCTSGITPRSILYVPPRAATPPAPKQSCVSSRTGPTPVLRPAWLAGRTVPRYPVRLFELTEAETVLRTRLLHTHSGCSCPTHTQRLLSCSRTPALTPVRSSWSAFVPTAPVGGGPASRPHPEVGGGRSCGAQPCSGHKGSCGTVCDWGG